MTPGTSYEFGPYRLEPGEARLLRGSEPVRLPPKALDVLVVLVKHAGRVVTKEELLADAWAGTFVEEGNLAVNVSAVRKALEDDAGKTYIETVPRRGYRFVAPVTVVQDQPAEARTPPPEEQPRPRDLPAISGAPLPPRGVRALRWARGLAIVAALGGVLYLSPFGPSPRKATIQSIAVLPFRAIAGAENQQHLELGMADAVITRLSDLPRLSVPPTAAIRAGEDPFEAGRRLGVDAVLTSTIQHDADRLRVTTQLSGVGDRRQIWAARFDERFTDIFAVQDAIADRIAESLLRDVSAAEREALHRRETDNVAAYELYLKGRERWSRRTPDAIQEAIRVYQEAIKLDPAFALAYTGLADAYATTASGLAPKTAYPLAKAAAERALALNPRLAEAHVALAYVSYKAEWNFELAERELRQAIALEPRHHQAYHQFGELCKVLGRWQLAITNFTRARDLDPFLLHTRADLAHMLIFAGRVPDARAVVEDGLKQDASSWEMRQALSEVLEAEGRFAESVEEDLASRLLRGEPQEEVADLRAAFQQGGREGYWRRQIEILTSRLERGDTARVKGVASEIAYTYALLREAGLAADWLERANARGEEASMYLNYPVYDFMRSVPQFQSIYKRVFGPV